MNRYRVLLDGEFLAAFDDLAKAFEIMALWIEDADLRDRVTIYGGHEEAWVYNWEDMSWTRRP